MRRGDKTKKETEIKEEGATGLDSLFVSKAEVDEIVQRAVSAAVLAMSTDMTAKFNSKLEMLQSSNKDINDEVIKIRADAANLNSKVTELYKTVISQSTQLDEQAGKKAKLQLELQNCLSWANWNEQYSRRNCIRIHGLQLDESASTSTTVVKFLDSKLGLKIDPSSFDAAHPLKSPKRADQSSQPVIVRFISRETKEQIIKFRKKLKSTRYVIHEDLTKLNMQLLNRVHNHSDIVSAWSSHGKVFGTTAEGRKIMFQPFDEIHSKISPKPNRSQEQGESG